MSSTGDTARSTGVSSGSAASASSDRISPWSLPPGSSATSSDGSVNTPSGANVIGWCRTNVQERSSGTSGSRTRKITGVRSSATEEVPLRRSTLRGYTPDWSVSIPGPSVKPITKSRDEPGSIVPVRSSSPPSITRDGSATNESW